MYVSNIFKYRTEYSLFCNPSYTDFLIKPTNTLDISPFPHLGIETRHWRNNRPTLVYSSTDYYRASAIIPILDNQVTTLLCSITPLWHCWLICLVPTCHTVTTPSSSGSRLFHRLLFCYFVMFLFHIRSWITCPLLRFIVFIVFLTVMLCIPWL